MIYLRVIFCMQELMHNFAYFLSSNAMPVLSVSVLFNSRSSTDQ